MAGTKPILPTVRGYAFSEGATRGFVLFLPSGYWEQGRWIRVDRAGFEGYGEEGSEPGRYHPPMFENRVVVTSDRVHWRAVRTENVKKYLPASVEQGSITSSGLIYPKLPADRLMVEWALRIVEWPDDVYSIDAVKEVSARTLRYGHATLDQDEGNGVTYNGFETIAKRSAHTLDALHATIVKAALECHRIWGWRPRGLDVSFHKTSKAMGLAFAPGHEPMRHRISLHLRMLETYDLHTIWRVLVHEFCHHYREEKWPRRGHITAARFHDQRFCEALRAVDSGASDAETCRWFINVEDPALAVAKKERIAARGTPPVWSVDAGYLLVYRLKSGKLRMQWKPRGLEFNWTKYVRAVGRQEIGDILTHFGPVDWARVEVKNKVGYLDVVKSSEPCSRGAGSIARYRERPVTTLSDLVDSLDRNHPKHFAPVVEFMVEMRAKHAQATG